MSIERGDGELTLIESIISSSGEFKSLKDLARKQRRQLHKVHKTLEQLNVDGMPIQYCVIKDGKQKIGILTTPIVTENESDLTTDITYYGVTNAGFVSISFSRNHLSEEDLEMITNPLHRGNTYNSQYDAPLFLSFHSLLRHGKEAGTAYISGSIYSEEYRISASMDFRGGRSMQFFPVHREPTATACAAIQIIQEQITETVSADSAALSYGVTQIEGLSRKKKKR